MSYAGLSDFNEDYAVVVVGGCEGSAVLGVVSIERNQPIHKLQLKAPLSITLLLYSMRESLSKSPLDVNMWVRQLTSKIFENYPSPSKHASSND